MLKSSVFIVMGVILGFILSDVYRSYFSSSQATEPKVDVVMEQHSTSDISRPSITEVSRTTETRKVISKQNIDDTNPAKTPYEMFKVVASLDNYSAKELQDYLMTLGADKVELRNQIAWILGGKYPEEALYQVISLMNSGDADVAKLVLQSVGQNHAAIAWDWVKRNEKELDNIFKTPVEKYEFKFSTLNMMARIPEQKWAAYEEAQILVSNSPQRGDKIRLSSVAENVASSDPEGAINYAISGGKRDTVLFNGALNSMVEKNVARAKEIGLQNQDILDRGAISHIANKLAQNNQLNEAYQFSNSLTNVDYGKTALNSMTHTVARQGLERAKEFASIITQEDTRYDIVRSMARSMGATGQPVKDQLALLDSSLDKLPAEKKSSDYAFAMREWSRTDTSAYTTYMSELRLRDKTLADAIEDKMRNFQKR